MGVEHKRFLSRDLEFCKANIAEAPCNILALIKDMLAKIEDQQTQINVLEQIVGELVDELKAKI